MYWQNMCGFLRFGIAVVSSCAAIVSLHASQLAGIAVVPASGAGIVSLVAAQAAYLPSSLHHQE
jgi:hypothetical protein